MTEEEFEEIFVGCAAEVTDEFYPKNSTAAHGGAPSGHRGEAMRDFGVLAVKLTGKLKELGVFSESH